MPETPARPPTPSRNSWIALAFDFGLRRIGVAAGDSLTRTARPVGVIHSGERGPDWAAIEKLVQDLQPAHLIVGLPLEADGTPSAMTAAAGSFAQELKRRFKLPLATVDERWSSLEAAERLKFARRSGRLKRRVRREDIDAAAACVILEQWWSQNKQS